MNRWMSHPGLALCALLLFTTPLAAQTPPAAAPAQEPAPPPPPPAPPPPPPPPAREGTAEFSFVGTTGNSSTSALGVGGEYISRRPEPWEFRAKVNYVRNRSEDELKAETFTASFRASRPVADRVKAFGQYGFLHDEFAGIEARNTVDGGITYTIVKPKPHLLEVDAGLGYAHESRLLGDDISTAQALFGGRYKWSLSETAEFSDEVGLSLSLSDSSDWRTSNTAALTAKVTSVFALKVSNTIRFVNAPAEGFENTDTITSIALVAKF